MKNMYCDLSENINMNEHINNTITVTYRYSANQSKSAIFIVFYGEKTYSNPQILYDNIVCMSKDVKTYIGRALKPIYESEDEVPADEKIFVFDLDETIGAFGDLHILWNTVAPKYGLTPNFDLFETLLDLYPEFLRYKILQIFEYLFSKRHLCKIYIYTNNQCDDPWVKYVQQYIEKKIGANGLFENPVCAFKIGNRRVELNRTTHQKTHTDFLKCTALPKTVEICFIDNTHHPKMENQRVYYIQPKTYMHMIPVKTIVGRFLRHFHLDADTDLYDLFPRRYPYSTTEIIDMNAIFRQVSHRIIYLLKEFFLMAAIARSRRTRRNSLSWRTTMKNRSLLFK